jgi:hypothetical protein
LAWHALTNDARKTDFPRRKTRIASIYQSIFAPTVVNDLRRKMRGWLRIERQTRETSSFPAGACDPREQNPRRRHSGPKTPRHSCLSGCRRATRPRFLLLNRHSHPSLRRKRSTQFLVRRCKRGEADMERFPRRPFGDHKSAPDPLRQL